MGARILAAGAMVAAAMLAGGPARAGDSGLEAAVAGDWRPGADTARDEWRHPRETLEFFGVDPSGAVAEIDPTGGYYARILVPWLAANGGAYTAVVGALDDENPELKSQLGTLAADAEAAGRPIEISYGELSADSGGIAPAGGLDAVLTFRNVHNWMGAGFAEKAFRDFYAALKPGGVLGVVEHRLPEDAEIGNTGRTGYVRASYVKVLAQQAGFVFEAESDVNANPADDHDHAVGVWTLRPTRAAPRDGTPEAEGFDRAAMDAVGESDRMTLRFRKPAE